MRLLTFGTDGGFSLTNDFLDDLPPYAILSHTWGADADEVTFADLQDGLGRDKAGFAKLVFCAEQAERDGIKYFWVDTCCINKANHAELSEAITSMFRWYRNAVKCYVYLADVSLDQEHSSQRAQRAWEADFRASRWFTRGWTLQELLAPGIVEFFSSESVLLGEKNTLTNQIHEITGIPVSALQGTPLSYFSIEERMQWAANRSTKRKEDRAYCLLGIFDVFMPLIYGEQENAIIRLKEELSKRSTNLSIQSTHTHWLVPRSANPVFTGRTDLLQELDDLIHGELKTQSGAKPCRVVVSGIGGQGKSELSLQLALRLRNLFWGVFWIDFSTTDMAERSLMEIAQKIDVSASTWEDAVYSIANLKQTWLLVLDNCDNLDVDYLEYFPESTLGVIIMTSRNEECQQYATTKPISLDGLSGYEARDLLLKAACLPQAEHKTHHNDAQIVASLLQSHPLALIQAGAYVSRGHCDLAHYPILYEQQRRRLLSYHPRQARSRYKDVYATFEVSTESLKITNSQASRDALRLLPILAACGASRLPLSLFEHGWRGAKKVRSDMADDEADEMVWQLTPWHVGHVPPFLHTDSRTWNQSRLVEAVSLLKVFSLVTTSSYNGHLHVSMHALIQAWARDRQNETQQHRTWLQIGSVVALALQSTDLSHKFLRQLQTHIEALTEWEAAKMFAREPPALVCRILLHFGEFLRDMHAYLKLSSLVNKVFTHLHLELTKVERSWIGLYQLAAEASTNEGKFEKVITILEQVVQIQRRSSRATRYEKTSCEHDLARAYIEVGRTTEAISLLKRIAESSYRDLADDHPNRLALQCDLAGAYEKNGNPEKAVELLEHVVSVGKQKLAEDHPYLLALQHELARAYETDGDFEKAMDLLEHVLRIKKRTLAVDHPSRLISQSELGRMYGKHVDLEQGIAMLQEVVDIAQQVLSEANSTLLSAQHYLATYLWEADQFAAAHAMMTQAVQVGRKALRKGDPNSLSSEKWLAKFEREMPQLKTVPSDSSIAPDSTKPRTNRRRRRVKRESKKPTPVKHRVLAWIDRHSH